MQVSRHGHIESWPLICQENDGEEEEEERSRVCSYKLHIYIYIYIRVFHMGGNCKCRDYSLPNMVTQSTSIMDMPQDLILIIITPKKRKEI